MSPDITDGCLETSWTPQVCLGRFSLDLVVDGGVEGERLEQFAVSSDDADVCVADEHADRRAGVAAAHPDVVQDAVVTQGALAVLIDDVVAEPEVVRDDGVPGVALGRAA
jgi:hypothetical protein